MKPIELLPVEYQESLLPYQYDTCEIYRDRAKTLGAYVFWGYRTSVYPEIIRSILEEYEEINKSLLNG